MNTANISILVLISNWQLSEIHQQQLLAMARATVVQELILVGKHVQELPQLLAGEPKLHRYQLHSESLHLMAEAGAFEASADVLVILKQNVILTEQALQEISRAIIEGYHFGGIIREKNNWWGPLLKLATVHCKGLFWFRVTQGYFVSRKVYHHSAGFKNDGRLISFFELLCRQEKLSRYTFLFFRR